MTEMEKGLDPSWSDSLPYAPGVLESRLQKFLVPNIFAQLQIFIDVIPFIFNFVRVIF